MEAFAGAFNAGDAGALAARWTGEGEYVGEAGVTLKGREALREGFAAHFKASPGEKAEIRAEGLRFLSRDAAIADGIVTIRPAGSGGPIRARYEAVLAREEGEWRIARLAETTIEGPAIEDLGWLVGDWKSKDGEGAEIATACAWAGGGKFLRVRFDIKHGDRAADGLQVIGVDPATGGIRSWTFEAGGGVAEADWERDGDHWTFATVGTTADGGTLTATNILRRVDDNTYTLQSVGRALDGEALPDMPPVKVSRVKTAK
jgi:uncharacterized protein (TIGR02246 family)